MSDNQITLIMLPGLDGTGDVFGPLLDCLPQSVEPMVLRYPKDRVMSFDEHVDTARAQIPTNKPFVLLAESFSGPVGLQLLADPPDNMIGVIFVATFDRYPRPFLLDIAKVLPQGGLLSLFCTTPVLRFFCLGSGPTSSVKLFRKALKSVDINVLSRRLQILAEMPPPPDVDTQLPCIYLQASKDRLVPERAAGRLQRVVPDMVIRQLDGPHTILLAEPESGAAAIADFVNSLGEKLCKS